MESDLYGQQKQIWRLIRSQRAETNELISTNYIERDTREKYLAEFYKKEETEIESNIPEIDIEIALQKLKNRKSPGLDNIANELLKYGWEKRNRQLTTLIRNIFSQHGILDEWRTSITILLFQKGDKNAPEL